MTPDTHVERGKLVRRNRLSRNSLCLCLMALASWAAPASAQMAMHQQEIEQLRKYAPILWLASGEPFYPTLPHPYAFDGYDNDGDGVVDLQDSDEISLAWRMHDKDRRVEHLAANFKARKPEPRVLYKSAAGDPKIKFDKVRNENPLDAIQLWFYYAADVGTGSHEGDSEHAFIFIDPDGTLPSEHRPYLAANSVRAVVGAGHTDDTANNILATGSLTSPTGVMPSALPTHMPMLVELGKHATAPDLTMDGRFNRGIDSNVFRQAAWGSRDGFGFDLLEFFSGYREEYSLPRNVKDVVLEEDALSGGYRTEYEDSFPHMFTDARQFEGNAIYRFFPVADLQGIYNILGKARNERDPTSLKELRKELEEYLEQHVDCFWRPDDKRDGRKKPTSFTLDDSQFAAFMQWLDLDDEHAQVWTKRDFKNPEDIFKTYLYPRLEVGFTSLWTQDKPAGPLLGASLRVAEFSIGHRPFLNDSSLEVYANFQTKTRSLYDFGLTYRYFRGGFGGPYFGMGWRGEDRRGSNDLSPDELARLAAEFGPAAAQVPERFERHTGIDLGYAIAWNMGRLRRGLRHITIGGTFGIRSELFAENLSPIEEVFNPDLPRRTRFQAKFSIHYGAVGPRHPMSR